MIYTQEKIFQNIAISITNILPIETKFSKAVLEIKRLTGNVGYTGYFITIENDKKWLDKFNLQLQDSNIHKLYEITQNHPLQHKNWNRAVFTLYPDNKFDMEYIWDQELQDRVDGYKAEFDNDSQ
ncbi:MAG: hypothetical protein WBA74_20740 [Cyclobacteriaceae bacterium]